MVNRFLQGTLILTIAGFVVKAIGSLNWIFYPVFSVVKVSVSTKWHFQRTYWLCSYPAQESLLPFPL